MEKKWGDWRKKLKKEPILICVLLGMVLLVIAWPVKEEKKEKIADNQQEVSEKESDSEREILENQLEEILEKVDGVGAVSVSITLASDGEKIVEKEETKSQESSSSVAEDGGQTQQEKINTEESVVYEKDGQGGEYPYVVSQIKPEIKGVIVVAQGGGNPIIRQDILDAVCALFEVKPHKIKIMKMKNEGVQN